MEIPPTPPADSQNKPTDPPTPEQTREDTYLKFFQRQLDHTLNFRAAEQMWNAEDPLIQNSRVTCNAMSHTIGHAIAQRQKKDVGPTYQPGDPESMSSARDRAFLLTVLTIEEMHQKIIERMDQGWSREDAEARASYELGDDCLGNTLRHSAWIHSRALPQKGEPLVYLKHALEKSTCPLLDAWKVDLNIKHQYETKIHQVLQSLFG